MAIKDFFEIPKRYRTWSLALIGVGVLSVIVGFLHLWNGRHGTQKRSCITKPGFWATLLHNSVYFLLIVNACMFFICATTLAWGGWQMAFRRVSEAISAAVPVIGIIAFGDSCWLSSLVVIT